VVRKFLTGNFLLFFGITALLGQSHLAQHSVDSLTRSSLTAEILQMGKSDQQCMFQIMFGEADATKVDSLLKLPDWVQSKILNRVGTNDYTLSTIQVDSLSRLQNNSDSINRKRVLEIFNQYGWPGYNLVGGEATGVITAILLHMPDYLMLELYPQLKKEAKKGNIYPSAVATMYDKYLHGISKPQLYGMFSNMEDDGKKSPPKIKSIKATNKARKKLGMPPLEKYQIIK
jgi:hypothetical protein